MRWRAWVYILTFAAANPLAGELRCRVFAKASGDFLTALPKELLNFDQDAILAVRGERMVRRFLPPKQVVQLDLTTGQYEVIDLEKRTISRTPGARRVSTTLRHSHTEISEYCGLSFGVC